MSNKSDQTAKYFALFKNKHNLTVNTVAQPIGRVLTIAPVTDEIAECDSQPTASPEKSPNKKVQTFVVNSPA